MGTGLLERGDVLGQLWPRESGTLFKVSQYAGRIGSKALESYAALADTFPFEEECAPTNGGAFGLLVREPVGVVGAIIPWNAPVALICHKIGPALLAGCTVVLKSSPEAPGEGNVFAEVAQQIGLPPGVLNVVTADREVSELLVRDPGVDKITFTGSTVAGRRIAALCGERIARCTLELGGKSAAVILDDIDLGTAAQTIARAECALSGQVCSSLTRIVVSANRHDELVAALADSFSAVARRRSLRRGIADRTGRERAATRSDRELHRQGRRGGRHARGRRRPSETHRSRVLRGADRVRQRRQRVDDRTRGDLRPGAQRYSRGRRAATRSALRTTPSTGSTRRSSRTTPTAPARSPSQLRSGTVGHNAFRTDFGMSFGGFKQSGIGREGGKEGLLPFLETKSVILEARPAAYGGDDAS